MPRVFHASRSGYFPFCIYTGTTGIGTGTMRPFGVSLGVCMEMFWRVKKWRAEFECGGISLVHEFFNLGAENGTGSPGGYPPPVQETDIVCRTGGLIGPPATFAHIAESTDSYNRALDFGLFLGGATPLDPLEPNTGTINDTKNMVYFNKNNNLYYPIFSCVIDLSDQSTFGAALSTFPFFNSTISSISIRFLSGIDEEIAVIPSYFYVVGPGSLPAGFSKADIKAIEYWPYEGLYDTTTGQPIN